jgi:hypothetical protein
MVTLDGLEALLTLARKHGVRSMTVPMVVRTDGGTGPYGGQVTREAVHPFTVDLGPEPIRSVVRGAPENRLPVLTDLGQWLPDAPTATTTTEPQPDPQSDPDDPLFDAVR